MPVDVLRRELMAVFAVRFRAFTDRGVVPPLNGVGSVLGAGADVEVPQVAARRIVTGVATHLPYFTVPPQRNTSRLTQNPPVSLMRFPVDTEATVAVAKP